MICGLCSSNSSDGSGLCPACRETLPESHHLSTRRKNKSNRSSPSQYVGQTNLDLGCRDLMGNLMSGFLAFFAFIALLISLCQ